MIDNEFESGSVQHGRSDTDELKAAASDLGDTARRTAQETGEHLAHEATLRAEQAKSGVADEISSVSKALRTASEELRNGSPQERTFGMVASNLADFADAIREKDLSEMVDDMSGFARRNPVAFLGGAALLGFAGVRMAKASRRARLSDDDPYGIRTVPSAGSAQRDFHTTARSTASTQGGVA